jgi:quercetin dioxygenase-like cupin family protein
MRIERQSPSLLRRGLAAVAVCMMASAAAAQTAPPLPREAMALDPKYDVTMMVFDVPPAPMANPTTKGLAGHKHPGSTYAYVVAGEVLSRLDDGPEKRFKAGEAWSETPGQAHYTINASTTTPAKVVVVFVVPKSATQISEPLK